MKIAGLYPAGNSVVVALPADYLRALGWEPREKLLVSLEEDSKCLRLRALKSTLKQGAEYEQTEK